MQQIQDKAKTSCMVSFRKLHSHLKLLSHNDLKGTQTESGFKRAFATLFGQDIETFTCTMFLNVDQLEKQLDKEEFQEIGYNVGKVDTCKALDASLVDIESSGTESKEQDTSSISGNDAYADDVDIRPIYDEEPMAEEKGFAITELKNELRKLTGNSVNTKFAKSSILGKPVLQPHRNQSVVRQLTASKSERPKPSKPRFSSQVNVNNDLSKPVTTHYLPKEREVASAKPQHMIASSNSRNSSKNMPRFSSNDMVHKHYLEEAKKKTQESVGLKWVPTEKIFTSSTTKVDSEPTNGSNDDITNQYECEQNLDVSAGTLNLSAGTLNLSAGTSFNPKKEGLRVCSELGIHHHNNEPSSSKLVPKVVSPADKTSTS
ncbi:hypothetical protein Tco_0033549 [Tanacetum coccineum]